MSLILLFILIAILFGLGGVFTAAKWLLVFCLLFLLLGMLSNSRRL